MFNDKMNMNVFIQGKKIDFNEEIEDDENAKTPLFPSPKDTNLNQNIQNFNNKIYINNNNIITNNYKDNNINNDLNKQNPVNDLNNYVDGINQNNNKNNVNNPNINAHLLNMNINMNLHISKLKCTCSKTGCQKKYCACLAAGNYCDGCNCKNCENQPNFKNNNNNEKSKEKLNINRQIPSPNTQRVSCNCTKSNCMKKYCECYKQRLICNSLCRCRECKNNNNQIKNNENINLINDSNIWTRDDIEYKTSINFLPEAFSICIRKAKLKEDERKINLNSRSPLTKTKKLIKEAEVSNFNKLNETPKYSNRKRARSKINISYMKTCPTSNSSRRGKRGLSNVNKNIEKKKLQLN